MKEHEIESLLQKYYEGETTLAEEKLLKQYLNKKEQVPIYRAEQEWFSQLENEKKVEVTSDFEHKLEEVIQQTELKKAGTATIWPLFPFAYRIAAILLLTLGLGLVVYFTLFNKSSQWIEVATSKKEIREVALPDGSKVWLNGVSTLRYSRELQLAAKREVWLEGEGYFEVAHKPDQPFSVHTGTATTQVLGTSFHVRSYPEELTVEVGVLSGKVAFYAENKPEEKVMLIPGHGAALRKENQLIRQTDHLDANLLAWKTRQLIFDDATLQEVIATLENYFTISIKTQDPALLKCRFKGKFTEARLEEILEVLQMSLEVSVTGAGNQYTISGKGCL